MLHPHMFCGTLISSFSWIRTNPPCSSSSNVLGTSRSVSSCPTFSTSKMCFQGFYTSFHRPPLQPTYGIQTEPTLDPLSFPVICRTPSPSTLPVGLGLVHSRSHSVSDHRYTFRPIPSLTDGSFFCQFLDEDIWSTLFTTPTVTPTSTFRPNFFTNLHPHFLSTRTLPHIKKRRQRSNLVHMHVVGNVGLLGRLTCSLTSVGFQHTVDFWTSLSCSLGCSPMTFTGCDFLFLSRSYLFIVRK